MSKLDDLPRLTIESRREWREWLAENCATSRSIWLVTYKKSDPDRYVSYNDIVEEALCFGWVDSLPRSLDDKRSMLLLAPRKPKSAWSRLNKERAERLIAGGQMTSAGLSVIKAARASGMWNKLDEVEDLQLPDDLTKALAGHGRASQHFDAFPRSVKRGILEWIAQAKQPETRARRIDETARLAADNIRANQWRQPVKPRAK